MCFSPFFAFPFAMLTQLGSSSIIAAIPAKMDQLLLTKGDNNPVDDIDLYNGIEWLEKRHIVGKVRG